MNAKFMRWSVVVGALAAIVVQSFIRSNRKPVKPTVRTQDEYEEFLGI